MSLILDNVYRMTLFLICFIKKNYFRRFLSLGIKIFSPHRPISICLLLFFSTWIRSRVVRLVDEMMGEDFTGDKEEYAADISSIREAYARIKSFVHRTPVVTSRALDELSGRSLYFKCECFQKG